MAKQVHKLTEAAVEKLQPKEQRYEKPDGGGLYLVVQPSGHKGWVFRYRHHGQPKKCTIEGSYPGVGLKAARKVAQAQAEVVAHGGNPAAAKATARHAAADRTTEFGAVLPLFLDRYLTKKQQRPKPRTLEELARLLGLARKGDNWEPKKGGLAHKWHGRKIAEITKGHIVDHLDSLVERGITANANRARAALHLLFGWCLRRGLVPANPCTAIDRPVAETSRSRVLTDVELALFWKAAGQDRLFGPLYKLLLLTGTRRDEVRGMTWAEVSLDQQLWTIPGSRTKNGRSLELPLSAPAIELLQAVPRIAKARLVFTTTGTGMLGGLSKAKARLDRAMLAIARETNPKATLEPFVTHDLRRTCATRMQKFAPPHVIEKVLNHSGGSYAGVAGTYQRDDLADEKRAALDRWAAHLMAVVTGEAPRGNVVPLVA